MNKASLSRGLTLLAAGSLLLIGSTTVRAQLSGGAPAGLSAAITKLFGTLSAFSANAEARVVDSKGQDSMRMKMKFANLDGKLRIEIDLNQIHSKELTPKQLAAMQQAGLRNIISIVRPDKKCSYILYPGVRNYSVVPLPKSDAQALEKDLEIQRTTIGRETLDGHECVKQRVVLKRGESVILDALTWKAEDLKGFPIQIQTKSEGNTSFLRFENIQFTRPEAKLFEIPAGYQENQ